MKKLLASVLSVTMLLSACGGGGGTPNSSAAKDAKLDFGTGGSSGTYYAYGGVLSNILTNALDGISITVQSTGASKANILGIADGDIQLGIVQNDVMAYAYNGTDLFEGDAIKDFSVVGALYAEVCQIIAVGDDIKSVADLKGKRVSVGDVGSGVEFNARQILEAYGLTFDDIKVNNLGFGDSANAIKDGKIDAFFCTAGAPTTAIVELATTKSINVIEIDDAHAKTLADKYPFYTQYMIPGGSYGGVAQDVKTVAVKATIIAANSLDEDVIYRFTKGLFENKQAIEQSHAKGSELSAEYAVGGISVPFHPGAQKYYKEVGALK